MLSEQPTLSPLKLVLTCEHGGRDIPKAFKKYFVGSEHLETHRGYDLGALDLFNHLQPLANTSFFSTTSRLVVELNRSIFHKQLFSEYTKPLSKIEKRKIIETHYLPYRISVGHETAKLISSNNTVLHLSIHSFTPELNGQVRHCDIGLLYDSGIEKEKEFCKQLKSEILNQNSNLNVRFNYPYLGKSDGFTTFLRKQFPKAYLGIEVEVNQKFVMNNVMDSEIKEILFKVTKGLLQQQ